MTDPTSTYPRFGRTDTSGRAPFSERGTERSSPTAPVGSAPADGSLAGAQPVADARAQPRADELVLSDTARQAAMDFEAFDSAKVEAIKEALRNGQYPLDSRRIAESFYRIEQMIQD
jgi:negative regulator of flagellin synthesis FlgM